MSDIYKNAGVNLEAGYESVERIKKHVKRTERLGVMGNIGAFGGAFDLSKLNMKEPVLVSGTDGVGTKLLLAINSNKHDTIGIDAVAMCVNDIITTGAKPLYFLDYIAVGKNEPSMIEDIVKGISDGCVQSNCAIVGGETAEMPGMYQDNHYDIAGFSVGAVEKSEMITGEDVNAGDILIGIPSSGVHSNGFSLVRRIIDDYKVSNPSFNEHDTIDVFGKSLIEELLTPTKIYVKPILDIISKVKINAISHITGGGFVENIPRVLKDEQGIKIDTTSFPKLPIFDYLIKIGNLDEKQLYNVFNMGIGMVLVTKENNYEQVKSILSEHDESCYKIGTVTSSSHIVIE